jgi:predicted nucleic-acid-binding protein
MRGLDTNILVRFLTDDEPTQSGITRRLIEAAEAEGDTFHISILVLAELVWVLRGGRHAFSRAEVADALDAILDAAVFEIQSRDLVRRAAAAFRAGPAEFSDYLIGEIDRRSGCTATLTFDRRLAAAEGFEVPGNAPGYPTRVSEP